MTLALKYMKRSAEANAARSPFGSSLKSAANSCAQNRNLEFHSTCIMHSPAAAMPGECHGLFSSLLQQHSQVNKLNLCNLADGNRLLNPDRLVNAALSM